MTNNQHITDVRGSADLIDLNGLWRFQPDAFVDGERLGYQQYDVDTRQWREVSVPCAFDTCAPQLAAYEGMGWFRREFDLPAEWLHDTLLLRFEGVNYNAKVWVNGVLAGSHEGGFLRFEFPVSNLLVLGRNVVAVCVDSTRRPGEVPGKERGWRPYGGILREVRLLRRPRVRIEQPAVIADASGAFVVRTVLCNDTDRACSPTISLQISDSAGGLVAEAMAVATVQPGGRSPIEIAGQADVIKTWSPDQPIVYVAHLRLADTLGTVLNEETASFGFRTIAVQGSQLLLNGQPLRLQGFNRHEDSFRTGMTPDPQLVESDLRHMKQLGANFVRLCHYPHHPLELDLCDRLGLLVMGEIPLYWWRGLQEGEERSQAKEAAAKRQLAEMIARDINHPSIIAWSVSNETEEQRSEVAMGNAALVEHARQLDRTRLATHVSDHWRETPHFEQDDIICVNGYPSWDGRGWQSNPTYDFAASQGWWDKHLAELHARYPDRPILVTEFGYPTLYGVVNNALGEDAQVKALRAEAGAFNKPYICGKTIWCYADHPWPEEPFINYMTNSPFGVVTRDRRRKRACDTVREIFHAPAPAPGLEDPPDNIQVTMIRPHLRDIPHTPFPEGYSVRPLLRNEGGLWEDIWRDAEQFMKIENGLFEKEFGDDPESIERRCYIIAGPDGVAVGTISSWYSRDINGLDYGRIHWVATRKAYQGRGIMRAGLSYALEQMAQWHVRAILGTSTGRIAAIKLYLDYGFLPDMSAPRAREAWAAFRAKLNHPALAVLDIL